MLKTLSNPLTFEKLTPGLALKKAYSYSPEKIIKQLKDSQLRGRGGAGFPTGIKWEHALKTTSKNKYVICNADEGEPGTFKDRFLLERFPEAIFDSILISAHAIKAKKAILYLRGEYSFLKDKLQNTFLNRQKENLPLANKIDLKIFLGSGAYICGEETALIESLEGKRGEPRDRPPYPVEAGFNEKPTIVNNVETLLWVNSILEFGPSWFNSVGTESSKGYKILSISGDCANPGVYEFPFGTTIEELLNAVEAQNTKAIQAGGASGICIPQKDFSRKIAFEDISTSGSIIIFNQNRDMLKVLKNFMEFLIDESCGQCTPCREGLPILLDGVNRLISGNCQAEYLAHLQELGETLKIASKCGLGQSAPNAFLSIINNFDKEIMGRQGGTNGF